MSRQVTTRAQQPAEAALLAAGILQRKCACGTHTIAGGECDSCRKGKATAALRRAARPGAATPAEAPRSAGDVLASQGSPLDASTRSFFESRFGQDFSGVRVHTDARAAQSAAGVGALAYTVGRDVVFGAGRYAPDTQDGRRLLAHELTHVVQQRDGRGAALQRAAGDEGKGARAEEEEAERNAKGVEDEEESAGSEQAEDKNLFGTPKEGKDKSKEKPKQKEKPKEKPKDKPKPEPKPKPKPEPNCTRNIFSEGTCAYLATHSKYICCDPDKGIKREGRKKDVDGVDCPSEKFTPIFTCDNKCDKALSKGCDDNDNWMAVPKNQFDKKQCGDVWTICANGKQTKGYVRDGSVTEKRFEVSPGIQKALGVKVGDSFKGAVYVPGAAQSAIDKDSCCKS